MSDALEVAAGRGRLVRRGSELLLAVGTAPGDDELVTAFAAAPVGNTVDDVTQKAANLGFAVGPFVAVEWDDDGARLAVFGDIAVVSDHPAMQRLSASESETWIEHRLRIDRRVELSIQGAHTDPLTDLKDGSVPADGFRLTLGPGADDTHDDDTPVVAPLDRRALRTDPTMDYAGGVPGLTPSGPGLDEWELRFTDGRVETIDGRVVLGRKPTTGDEGGRAITLECSQVSANHLAVTADVGGVVLTDLGSRNRTWTLTSGDQQLTPLDPHTPTRIGDGVHVQVGTIVFVVSRRTPNEGESGP